MKFLIDPDVEALVPGRNDPRLTSPADAGMPITSPWRPPCLAGLLPLATLVLVLGLWALWPAATVLQWVAEGGPVETMTALLFWALALAAWFIGHPGQALRLRGTLSLMFAACAARELDWHRAWTGTSSLKVSFYLGSAPWPQKLVALLVLACIAVALADLVNRFAQRLLIGLRRHEALAMTVACFLATMVVSKVLDRSVNLLAEDFGIHIPMSVKALIMASEESLEFTLPLIAALGLFQYGRGGKDRARYA